MSDRNERLKKIFRKVVGPGDPLWPAQLEVARQVIAAGGIPANELQEWLAVQRESGETGGDA
jgi:hypothetical protein